MQSCGWHSQEFLEHDQQATIAALKAQALRYETAIDKISQGVCFFDGEERLILCNRRYAEIYKLKTRGRSPAQACVKSSERRFAIGTMPMAVDDYLAWAPRSIPAPRPKTWTAELKDGRTIHICHQPMPDGGWVATHEDITELKAKRAVANERISLQALIDLRARLSLGQGHSKAAFVVANKALAVRQWPG